MTEKAQSAPTRDEAEPDLLLMRQIAAGDRDAFEKLYKTYATRLFRYLFSVAGDSTAAEELTSDVMVVAWKAAAQFRGEAKVSTWLFGIAHHKALNELRRRRPETVEIEEAGGLAAHDAGPEAAARRADIAGRVRSALRQLSPEHREVVELTFYQGFAYQEIAEIMQCPVNTVKTRMFYARKKLQDVLEKAGITGEMA
jgi:RNA polymerase sigma-70 factor (ECF subfamily)